MVISSFRLSAKLDKLFIISCVFVGKWIGKDFNIIPVIFPKMADDDDHQNLITDITSIIRIKLVNSDSISMIFPVTEYCGVLFNTKMLELSKMAARIDDHQKNRNPTDLCSVV